MALFIRWLTSFTIQRAKWNSDWRVFIAICQSLRFFFQQAKKNNVSMWDCLDQSNHSWWHLHKLFSEEKLWLSFNLFVQKWEKHLCKTTNFLQINQTFLSLMKLIRTSWLIRARLQLNWTVQSGAACLVPFFKVILFPALLVVMNPSHTHCREGHLILESFFSHNYSKKKKKCWQGKELWLSSLGTLMQILSELRP